MSEIDPILYGKLVQSVETLTKTVEAIEDKVDALTAQMQGGRGIVVGLMLAAGGLGAGASKALEHLLK